MSRGNRGGRRRQARKGRRGDRPRGGRPGGPPRGEERPGPAPDLAPPPVEAPRPPEEPAPGTEVYRGLRLHPFQQRALDAIRKGSSVLVAAPTGAGKTLVADFAIERALAEGKRIFYTAPVKALS